MAAAAKRRLAATAAALAPCPSSSSSSPTAPSSSSRSSPAAAVPAVVLVTSVTQFLGGPAALRLLRAGFNVAVHDATFAADASSVADTAAANASAADARTRWLAAAAAATPGAVLVQGLQGDGLTLDGARLWAVPCHADASALVAAVVARFGRIDVLISNDAYPAVRSPIERGDADLLRESLAALLVRPYEVIAATVRQMRAQPPPSSDGRTTPRGKIVLVTSAAPLRGLANYAPYVAARGAANALVLSLAQELAPDRITVNALAPNYVASPTYFPAALLSQPEVRARIEAKVPLGRLATPAEAAETLLFLASSPQSDFYTGQVLAFAGGWA